MLLAVAMLPAAVASGLSGLIIRLRPSLSLWRTILAASLPLPLLLTAWCAWVFFDAATAPKGSCGIDACAMSMMMSLIGLSFALFALLVGGLAAAWTKRTLAK